MGISFEQQPVLTRIRLGPLTLDGLDNDAKQDRDCRVETNRCLLVREAALLLSDVETTDVRGHFCELSLWQAHLGVI